MLAANAIGSSAPLALRAYKVWSDAYTYPSGVTNKLVLGEMALSESIVVSDPLRKIGPFKLWRVPLPISINPTWDKMADFDLDFSKIAIKFKVEGSSAKTAMELRDILPNTQFVPSNYGGKAKINIGLKSDPKFVGATAQAEAEAGFWWEWNPKINIIASGAAGNSGSIVLSTKPDGTRWFGKLPIELLLLVPEGEDTGVVTIETQLVYDGTVSKLAEVKCRLIFYE